MMCKRKTLKSFVLKVQKWVLRFAFVIIHLSYVRNFILCDYARVGVAGGGGGSNIHNYQFNTIELYLIKG